MSVINIADVKILKNDCLFNTNFEFEITFECLAKLAEDLEFKVIYVVCPHDEKQDQELECVSVGPVPIGINKFVLEAPPPNASLISEHDLLGVTAVLLHVSYMNCEFVRIGYLVNNEYGEEELKENPPSPPQIDRIYKSILADKPRVTRFHIN
ncbi:Histone chaperone asf1, partial [Coelomomyces lativittatus]